MLLIVVVVEMTDLLLTALLGLALGAAQVRGAGPQRDHTAHMCLAASMYMDMCMCMCMCMGTAAAHR